MLSPQLLCVVDDDDDDIDDDDDDNDALSWPPVIKTRACSNKWKNKDLSVVLIGGQNLEI